MCGIYVEISRNAEPIDRERMVRGAASLERRGPDEGGFLFRPGAALAHRRLSIIDLASGRQPLANEDGTVHIVFNGEIYNFPELRRDLEGRGHRFATRSDTEVIVHLFEEKGEETPRFLNGAFAFAIYEERRRRLYFCRDRLGIKPLFVREVDGRLCLASNVDPLLALGPVTVDQGALDDFLTYGYVPGPRTVWQEITQVEPGTWGFFDARGIRRGRYWDFPAETKTVEPAAWTEAFLGLLDDAVKRRLVSDVPLGAFLSGGIDSSTIVALMRRSGPVRTFTIGFPAGTQDETEEARLVADHLGCRSVVERLDLPREQDLIDAVTAIREPFADPSLLPTFLVSRVASREVKVALAGDGADELFAGYPWFTTSVRQFRRPAWCRRTMGLMGRAMQSVLRPSPRGSSVLSRFCRYARDGAGDLVSAFLRRRSVFAPALKQSNRSFSYRIGSIW